MRALAGVNNWVKWGESPEELINDGLDMWGAGGGGERGAQSHIILSGESENIGQI